MFHLGGVLAWTVGTGVGAHGTHALSLTTPDVTNATPQSLLLPPRNLHLELHIWTPKDNSFRLAREQ